MRIHAEGGRKVSLPEIQSGTGRKNLQDIFKAFDWRYVLLFRNFATLKCRRDVLYRLATLIQHWCTFSLFTHAFILIVVDALIIVAEISNSAYIHWCGLRVVSFIL